MSLRAFAWLAAGLGALVLVTGCGSSQGTGTAGSTTGSSTHAVGGTGGPTQPGGGQVGAEGIPIELGPSLAPASTTTPGTPVHGIRCEASEQVAYHIHAHLQVYVNGQPRQLPGGIGIIQPLAQQSPHGPFYGATRCYYWLHTHTADGIIHIESPTTAIYTLGQFFDEWRQPLSSTTVATAHGPVTALVNGKRWSSDPRDIPLHSHTLVQLEVGKPLVPFHSVSFAGTGL